MLFRRRECLRTVKSDWVFWRKYGLLFKVFAMWQIKLWEYISEGLIRSCSNLRLEVRCVIDLPICVISHLYAQIVASTSWRSLYTSWRWPTAGQSLGVSPFGARHFCLIRWSSFRPIWSSCCLIRWCSFSLVHWGAIYLICWICPSVIRKHHAW